MQARGKIGKTWLAISITTTTNYKAGYLIHTAGLNEIFEMESYK